jgi:hypothetical protein
MAIAKNDEDVEAGKELELTDNTYRHSYTPGESSLSNENQNDLLWSNINMKLLEKKGSDQVKMNILKVRFRETTFLEGSLRCATYRRNNSLLPAYLCNLSFQNVWGKAEAGKTTAIMGASGAGSKLR